MLTIGKVSSATGCNIETIRFYEKEGLLPAPARSSGGHRLYSAALVDRLSFILRCRNLGFSMPDVRQLLSLVDGHEVTQERVKGIVNEHLAATREEEGIGICAGAWLGGRFPAILMQNSGLTNAVSPLTSLNYIFQIPVLGFVSLDIE